MKDFWYKFFIVALLVLNLYAVRWIYVYKTQRDGFIGKDALHSLKLNLRMSVENSNYWLNNFTVTDSSGCILPLSDFWLNESQQMFVCRFSESHCNSCVEFMINSVRQWAPSIGKDNVLILCDYRDDRIFNRIRALYQLDEFLMFNVRELEIPIEDYGFPYCFVLNKNQMIADVFVPDKAAPMVTSYYFDLLKSKYFLPAE